MKFSIGPWFLAILFMFVAPSCIVCNTENYNKIELPKVIGAESIAFDCHGNGPYVSVSDGRILKWQGSHLGWTEFAIPTPNRPRILCDGSSNPELEPTCGRPLGIKFHPKTCELYIADAYFGLLKVGPNGGVAQQLATSAEGIPFRFTNALDIDTQTGVVYFTDTSIFYQRRVWIESIMAGDKSGRLMKYDPTRKKVTVLLRGLAFANGVAISKENSFILVGESGTNKILRLWLRGPKAQNLELFAQLQRSPDNIKTNEKGEFWIALNSGREPLQNLQGETKQEAQVVKSWLSKDPVAIKFDNEGKTVKVLDGNGGSELSSVSEVEEHNGSLWIGSAVKHYVCVQNSYNH